VVKTKPRCSGSTTKPRPSPAQSRAVGCARTPIYHHAGGAARRRGRGGAPGRLRPQSLQLRQGGASRGAGPEQGGGLRPHADILLVGEVLEGVRQVRRRGGELARALAKKPYAAPAADLPDAFKNLTYEQYIGVRARPTGGPAPSAAHGRHRSRRASARFRRAPASRVGRGRGRGWSSSPGRWRRSPTPPRRRTCRTPSRTSPTSNISVLLVGEVLEGVRQVRRRGGVGLLRQRPGELDHLAALAKKPYAAPAADLPDAFKNLTYEQYIGVRAQPTALLWGATLPKLKRLRS
jgi:hypothetical protein